jgi:hypothetical protein
MIVMRVSKKGDSATALLFIATLFAVGCGADKQESVTANLETFTSADGNIGCIAGDTTMNSGSKLRPGTVNAVGPFQCSTNEFGDSMRCENMETGSGFELLGGEYSVF